MTDLATTLRRAGFDTYNPSDEELAALSHMIGEMKRRHKAGLCSHGMTGEPECRSLEEAMRDIRRRAEKWL